MRFSFTILASVLAMATSAVAVVPDPLLPKKYNGQNVTLDYEGELVGDNTKFGLGALRSDETLPTNAFDFERWEGPNTLGFDDQDILPAVFLLNYPFFTENYTYTVQLFEFYTTNGTIKRPYIRQETFVWVSRPGGVL